MDLVVDHALEVDHAGSADAAERNLRRERERHRDRLEFLEWAAGRLPGLRVVPPGVGICHQLNLEVLARVVHLAEPGLAAFDSVLGTDSHTTMINGLSVVGWGVGGIEATAAAMRHPVAIPVPEVVGVRLVGALPAGVLATDVALRLTADLRGIGVLGAVVEFCGPALAALPVPDRATIANMAPEYGATMAYFPPDEATLAYLALTGRPEDQVALARDYLRVQGLLTADVPEPEFGRVIELDLGTVGRSMAGPSRPAERRDLGEVAARARETPAQRASAVRDGDVVIAAITSCTNTSNPRAMVAAGLLARNARRRGLTSATWVKTSLTPGSRSATALLADTGLQASLDELGFQVAGHGCATCMGNSGPLPAEIERDVAAGVQVAAVLSGNRNFPGRVHPSITASYLASPPLVVAAAIAGSVRVDLATEPLGHDDAGAPVHLVDVWPSDAEIEELVAGAAWRVPAALPVVTPDHRAVADFAWQGESGMIRRPPFADLASEPIGDVRGARPLLLLGDGVTTDDISPVGRITPDSAAGRWLRERAVTELGSFAGRRLNHDVMVRGGFANPRLVNRLAPDAPGGWTTVYPEREVVPVHKAAARYAAARTPVVVVAGDSYGAGSARDWAAKVTRLLGVRAVLAVGFERIHRTNLVAMGVLPVRVGADLVALLTGEEILDVLVEQDGVTVIVHRDGEVVGRAAAVADVRTAAEAEWLRAGGLLPHLVASALLQAE
jgi:aconitate hydratase